MKELASYSTLIGAIYDSILQPEGWKVVLERMCHILDAKAASVHVINPIEGRASLFVEHGTDPVWTAMLLSRYAAMSPIGAAVLIADVDQPVGAFDFIDEEEFVDSRFYKEWCAPQGYHDMLGAIIAKRPREVGAISATRAVEKGRFGTEARDFMGLLAPHVRRAVTINGLLEQRTVERNAFASVMDQLAAAVLLVDGAGRCLRVNPAAERLCAAGSAVSVKNGVISLADAAAAKAMRDALVAPSPAPHLIPLTGSDGVQHVLALLLIDPKSGTHALMVNQQEAETPAIGRALAELYGLTPREICVLMPLLEGKTIEDISAELGVALATAKSHLNKLFAKTGTTRQADLVQCVLRALPPVRT